MSEPAVPKWCGACKHFNGINLIFIGSGIEEDAVVCCKAFPEKIPEMFSEDGGKHTKVIDGQVGDFVFEPV